MKSAVNFKAETLLVLYGQVINKYLRMKTSINLESLTEIPKHFGGGGGEIPAQEKKNRYLDKLTVYKHHFLA